MRWLTLGLMVVAACGDDYLGRDVRVVFAPWSDQAVLAVT